VQIVGERAYYRCPKCEVSFRVRRDDAVAPPLLALGAGDARITPGSELPYEDPTSSVWRNVARSLVVLVVLLAMLAPAWAFWFHGGIG
jgi:hypothetical protein